jgi:uncharacterized repeat protein (TIGR01451 family)
MKFITTSSSSFKVRAFRTRAWMLALLVGVCVTAQAQTADNLMYGIDNTGTFEVFLIDPATGDASNAIGNLSYASAAVARHPTSGLLYYTAINPYQSGRYRVTTFNPATGVNTNLSGFVTRYLPRLAFHPNGTLYGMDLNNHLIVINTATGSEVSDTTITCSGSCTGWTTGLGGDIAFAPDGTLYFAGGSTLFRISGSTATRVGATGTPTLAGLSFGVDGFLYASDTGGATSNIYRLSTATGAGTLIGTSGEWLSDMTALPKFANLSITKTATGSFVAGTDATYTITIDNSGPQNASGPLTVTDTLPAGVTYSSVSSGWSCSAVGQNVTCSRAAGLNNGANTSFTLTVTLASNVSASIVNSATVSSTTFDHVPANNTESETTTVTFPPDLTISKSHTGNFTQGQIGTYTINVTNSGSGPTTSTITVTDTLPAGLTFSSGPPAPWSCSAVGQTVTCTSNTVLAAGANSSFTFDVSVASNAPFNVTNTASVSTTGEIDTSDNSASDPTTIDGVPDLTITKSHSGNFTQGQNNATYTLTVTNSGTGPTSGQVTVTDTLPASLTFVSGGPAPWSCGASGQVVTCTRSDALAASNSYPALVLTVNVSAIAPASVTNTASVSGGGETNTGNNSASDPTTINQLADLTIVKTHTGNFTRGTNDAYTITVTNSGAAATDGSVVTVTDTLPAGLTPTPWSGSGWTCGISSQTVTCTRSTVLNAGASYPAISIPVTVEQNAPSSLTNTASVSGGGQVNTANDTASDPTTVVSSSDLSLTKVVNNSGSGIGTEATFTITLTNSGPSNATGVAVRDQLPAGLTYVSSTPSVGTYDSGTGIWSIGNLASGTSVTLTLVARIDALGSLNNTAQVSASDQPDPDSTPNNNNAAEDDQASTSINVTPPSLSLCKTIIGQLCPPNVPLNMPPGSDISYVVNFTNNGGSMASDFVLTDPSLPPISTLKLNDYTYFKVGSVVNNLPAGLSLTELRYSADAGLTWNYTPISGAGGAPVGYDANVTHIQWRFGGQLSPGSNGNVSFTVQIK